MKNVSKMTLFCILFCVVQDVKLELGLSVSADVVGAIERFAL